MFRNFHTVHYQFSTFGNTEFSTVYFAAVYLQFLRQFRNLNVKEGQPDADDLRERGRM